MGRDLPDQCQTASYAPAPCKHTDEHRSPRVGIAAVINPVALSPPSLAVIATHHTIDVNRSVDAVQTGRVFYARRARQKKTLR